MIKLGEIDVAGKAVFVRADLDVPLEQLTIDSHGHSPWESLSSLRGFNAEASSPPKLQSRRGPRSLEISNQQSAEAIRLTSLKATVDYLLERNCQVVVGGHIDRPAGASLNLSTQRLVPNLEQILGRKVNFHPDIEDHKLEKEAVIAGVGQVILLENLRFWPGEVENDSDFATKLARFAEIYINEAFGNCHRAHASMVALPAMMIHAAGLHLVREIENLTKALNRPQRPLMAIVGGAKIETKVPVIENLAKVADFVIVGGELPIEIAKGNFSYPSNVVVASLEPHQKEIDQSSIVQTIELVKRSKTVVWNGPLGVFEEGYDNASKALAQAIIASGAFSVVGGGETTQMLAGFNLLSKFSFVSSGGGAMLEFLAGHKLPGLKALE